MAPFIEVRKLGRAYVLDDGREITALDNVDVTIEPGEFVALIGANGSGKTTLAHHVNALLVPSRGEVIVDGLSTCDPENRWAVRRRVGMVFQNPENQLVASTVEEDVAFGPENWALPRAEIRERVDEALDIVGLAGYRTTPPQMLSGGQKQLVAIAGALATHPQCLVLDEPTSMLDPVGRSRVMDTVHRLNAEEGLTIVLITQSMDEAASSDRILVMSDGQIAMDGPPHRVFDRRDRLQALGLALPVAVEIANHLRQRDVPLASTPLTVAALAEALGSWEQGETSLC